MRGMYWEEWEIGAEFESPARTVTEADITLFAFLGFENLKFTHPVKPGDTIHARIKVLEKRETSRADRGVMKRRLEVLNQRGELVQEGIQAFLLKRKPA